MWPNPQENVDLVKFDEEILNEKLFLYNANPWVSKNIEKNFISKSKILRESEPPFSRSLGVSYSLLVDFVI